MSTAASEHADAPEVSVVVVAWRARDYVLRCLTALEEHAGMSYEAIVVDDGSGDGTPEAVSERFPSVRVLAKRQNEGLVAGRNDALEMVRGRFVFMLDADTEVHPGALATLTAALDENPAVGIVSPKLLYPNGELQLSCRRWSPSGLPFFRRGPYAWLFPDSAAHRRHLMSDYDHKTSRPVVWTLGAAQMYRADLPALIGLYDPHISSYGGEDRDWCLRALAIGLQVRYEPAAEVTHVFQQVTRKKPYGRKTFLHLRDFYYLQWKHRRMRRSPQVHDASY
jgi:GT2 family glycosyltransferase